MIDTAGEGPERVLLPIATGAQTRAALWGLLTPRRGLAAGTLVVLVSATAVNLLTAPLLGRIVDLAAAKAPAAAITPRCCGSPPPSPWWPAC